MSRAGGLLLSRDEQAPPFRASRTSPETIRLAVTLRIRFPLSLRDVEGPLHGRSVDVSHATQSDWQS